MSDGDAPRNEDLHSDPPPPAPAEPPPAVPERFDDEGLPLDRPATLDDVRGTAGSGRSIAIGCTVFVALAVLAFWLLRAGLLG